MNQKSFPLIYRRFQKSGLFRKSNENFIDFPLQNRLPKYKINHTVRFKSVNQLRKRSASGRAPFLCFKSGFASGQKCYGLRVKITMGSPRRNIEFQHNMNGKWDIPLQSVFKPMILLSFNIPNVCEVFITYEAHCLNICKT